MKKRPAGILAGVVMLVLAAAVQAAPSGKPNILLIVSDDAGYADFGFQGCKDIPTPRLNQLATGQAANTLVIFVNDNGGATYSKFYNVPLRGHKGTLFDGGIRVPFLARWPGVLPADKTFDAPVCATDLLPTFLAAAGAAPSTWRDSDGVNLLPFLTGKEAARPHQTLFWRFNVVAAVRDGDWKLIRVRGADPLLFNLATDLPEKRNLAAAEPGKVKELLQKISAWEKPFPAARWSEDAYWEKVHFKDHTGPPHYQGPVTSPVVDQE